MRVCAFYFPHLCGTLSALHGATNSGSRMCTTGSPFWVKLQIKGMGNSLMSTRIQTTRERERGRERELREHVISVSTKIHHLFSVSAGYKRKRRELTCHSNTNAQTVNIIKRTNSNKNKFYFLISEKYDLNSVHNNTDKRSKTHSTTTIFCFRNFVFLLTFH